jgi:2-pyrone-4,6-dicarboxylate lactonase
MELLMHVDEFPDLDRMLSGFLFDTVYGHLGYMHTAKGIDHPGFLALLRLLESSRAWVKLTGPYRITAQPLVYADTIPYARALIEAAPKQVLWGSDWPHVIVKGNMPNDGDLCDLLLDWVPQEVTRTTILIDNPARLYGFT